MSTPAELQVAREKRAAARMALAAALLGSLIGGFGALAGAYLTYSLQVDTHKEDTKRTAYVDFLAAETKLRAAILEVHSAVDAADQKAYETASHLTSQASEGLYPSTATLYIVTEKDSPTSDTASKVNNLLLKIFTTIRSTDSVTDYDLEESRRQVKEASDLVSDFLDAAQADLQGD